MKCAMELCRSHPQADRNLTASKEQISPGVEVSSERRTEGKTIDLRALQGNPAVMRTLLGDCIHNRSRSCQKLVQSSAVFKRIKFPEGPTRSSLWQSSRSLPIAQRGSTQRLLSALTQANARKEAAERPSSRTPRLNVPCPLGYKSTCRAQARSFVAPRPVLPGPRVR
jgi:hypothetical protein